MEKCLSQVIALFLRSKFKDIDPNKKNSGKLVPEEQKGQPGYPVLETLR